jgi:hypothetical protein
VQKFARDSNSGSLMDLGNCNCCRGLAVLIEGDLSKAERTLEVAVVFGSFQIHYPVNLGMVTKKERDFVGDHSVVIEVDGVLYYECMVKAAQLCLKE